MTITMKKYADTDKKKLPVKAFRLAEKPFKLSAAGDAPEGKYPVRLVCRTSAPVESWFWGTCYHDFDGLILPKERVPIDYIHDDAEVIGFLDNFSVENGELVATGELTPFRDDDRASEIICKLKAGVPYEASINFSGETKIEEVAKKGVAQVNGISVDGPCLIFREWTLRGVAICPYGADGKTSTSAQFCADGETIPVTVLSAEESAPVENPRELFRRMKEDFGIDIASKVFIAGGGYEDARLAKFDELQIANADYRAEIDRLKDENQKLAASSRTEFSGGGTPATFTEIPPVKRLTLMDACKYGTKNAGRIL